MSDTEILKKIKTLEERNKTLQAESNKNFQTIRQLECQLSTPKCLHKYYEDFDGNLYYCHYVTQPHRVRVIELSVSYEITFTIEDTVDFENPYFYKEISKEKFMESLDKAFKHLKEFVNEV